MVHNVLFFLDSIVIDINSLQRTKLLIYSANLNKAYKQVIQTPIHQILQSWNHFTCFNNADSKLYE